MSFENPYIFFVLIVPFILFAGLVLTNKEGIERVFSKKVLDRIKVEDSPISNRVRNVIFFIAIFLMIVAMSEPVIKKGEQKVKISGLEIALAIDLSASMRSQDLYPNRLEYAKKKIKELLNYMPNDEFMVITFANNLFFVSPFTSDKYTLTQVIDGISKDYIQTSTNYTNLALGLSDILKDKMQKIAVIVTDGGDEKELQEFERIIKKNKIKLYVVLVGTRVGAPVLDNKGKKVFRGDKIVVSKVNFKIAQIAKDSGGDYILLNNKEDKNEIKKLVLKIKDNKIFATLKKEITIKNKTELFYYPLIVSTILLLIAFSSLPSALRGKK